MNYIRNACVSPELDVHGKIHYNKILNEYARKNAVENVVTKIRNFVVPVHIFVHDEFEKLYEEI